MRLLIDSAEDSEENNKLILVKQFGKRNEASFASGGHNIVFKE